VNCIIKLLFF